MPAHDDGGTVTERFTAMMFLSSEVERLQAQVEADDALLLRLEWFLQHMNCPCCDNDEIVGHTADCDLGRRCDEARARQESKR
jgi:hypothetical protein